jgi:hypothetical protein
MGEVTRDRNAEGRAENARPRDATGKPLARDAGPSWRERLRAGDEARALPKDEALAEAERLILTGQPFYAHEVLEGPWHLAEPPERAFWQGLAQVAVGLTHVQRGTRRAPTSWRRTWTGSRASRSRAWWRGRARWPNAT